MGWKDHESVKTEKCRIIVLGAPKPRLAKVMSILVNEANHDHDDDAKAKEEQEAAVTKHDILSTDEEHEASSFVKTTYKNVEIEYLPCVPTFDSYEGADGKTRIRYLVKVDYFGNDGTTKSPQGLLPFFDEMASSSAKDEKQVQHNDTENRNHEDDDLLFPYDGISGMFVGLGIDCNNDDVVKVGEFLETMCKRKIPYECIDFNSDTYTSMEEELAAFKALSVEDKATATHLGTMGPGKMAKRARDFAHQLIDTALLERSKKQQKEPENANDEQKDEKGSNIASDGTPVEIPAVPLPPPKLPDPNLIRYSCRKCRTMLFDTSDFQDPPHVPSKHKFSYRKHDGAGSSKFDACQSLFLQSSMEWMGNTTEIEGKLNCPRCQTKIGTYHWSGAQCSCGTWVVPAIQVPCSRVDEVPPVQQPSITTVPHGMNDAGHSSQSSLPGIVVGLNGFGEICPQQQQQ